MRNLLNPYWLLVINTLPLLVLFVLFYGQFNIIKSLLKPENIQTWKELSILLGALGLLHLGFTNKCIQRKKKIPLAYAIVALLVYINFLYLYSYQLNLVFPPDVPEWMLTGNVFLYPGTFLMPTMAHALLVLVHYSTPETKPHKPWLSFLVAISIPLTAYVVFQTGLPFWKVLPEKFETHVVIVMMIVGTLVFLFYLIRGSYILTSNNSRVLKEYAYVWKFFLTLLLPVAGLLVNNGLLLDLSSKEDIGVFGNFNNYWFYILAIVNGIALMLPQLVEKWYRVSLFAARSATFAYTLYFFLVMLPYTPLSVVLIVAFGSGFLMMVPSLLFVLHIQTLHIDYEFLKTFMSKYRVMGLGFLSISILPVAITLSYMNDRRVLENALEYIDAPDYNKEYSINQQSLKSTLLVLERHKVDNNQDLPFLNHSMPYLSSYFNWLVLDNLVLSDAKFQTLEKTFLGTTSYQLVPDRIDNDGVVLDKIAVSSNYDTVQRVWRSWIDLELINKNPYNNLGEYATTFQLPEGCWVSDYYLYIKDQKEFGLLAEKKAAMWIFNRIRGTNRDPGILYYLTGNKLAFRVFPFAVKERRKTGIEFIHKEPCTFLFDGQPVSLGQVASTRYENMETEQWVFLSSRHKQTLPKVQRTPYFHFLLDASAAQSKNRPKYIRQVDSLLSAHPALARNVKVSYVSAMVNTVPLKDNWKAVHQEPTSAGGCFLDRAIRSALVKSYQEGGASYPILVVLTDSLRKTVLDKDFADLEFTYPDAGVFYALDEMNNLKTHSLSHRPLEPLVDSLPGLGKGNTVLQYLLPGGKHVYLPDDGQPSMVLKSKAPKYSDNEFKEKQWRSALQIQSLWRAQILDPSLTHQQWLPQVRYSFKSHVMSPVTSFLVVENEAQKAMLKKKQDQVLSGHPSFDPGEDAQRMSEPGILLIAFLLGGFFWWRKQRRQHISS